MKTLYILMLSFIFFSFQENEPIYVNSTNEVVESISSKDSLKNYLNETAESLENEIAGISESQLQFKPSEESWSISQVLEHIIATEKMLLKNITDLTSQTENSERRAEIKILDDQLVSGITDRSNKVKTSKELEPMGIYNSSEDALKDFKEVRSEITSFLDSFPGNLRNHITDSPFGVVDAHQLVLFAAGHTARHTKQIQELKSNPAF